MRVCIYTVLWVIEHQAVGAKLLDQIFVLVRSPSATCQDSWNLVLHGRHNLLTFAARERHDKDNSFRTAVCTSWLMGQKLSRPGLSRKTFTVDERYCRPQGLYTESDVDLRKLKKLIVDRKLAPCWLGRPEDGLEVQLPCRKAFTNTAQSHPCSHSAAYCVFPTSRSPPERFLLPRAPARSALSACFTTLLQTRLAAAANQSAPSASFR